MTNTALAAAPLAPSAAATRKGHVALWAAQIVLGAFMIVASGVPKFFAVEAAVQNFDAIGYGDWFMYAVGVLEVAGGIALLIPRLAGLAATALTALMVGAEVFTWVYLETTFWYTPVILGAAFAAIAYRRRAETADLYRSVRAGTFTIRGVTS
ncbi:DoxX family protein [Streptomyces sp. NPDC051940]|uniref:DoxX family protein n=1 Tax=Streptomyces sp. NPDC051940 TaxID=3155675 RepID=UPI003441A191